MKNYIFEILAVYSVVALVVVLIRFMAMDCAHRYADYVFPLSKLHCEIR